MTNPKNSDFRQFSWQDRLILNVHKCIRTAFDLPPKPPTGRPNPAAGISESNLSPQEQALSCALMRINHTGEVCAQALYLGQSLTAKTSSVQAALSTAAQEEYDHLSWCEQRIQQLGGRTSYLNPFWYTTSLGIGCIAGLVGDQWSLGFLAQTENQVYTHLGSHLEKLPAHDNISRTIVSTMQAEEANHASTAINQGASELPLPIKITMQWMAKVMTTVTYYL